MDGEIPEEESKEPENQEGKIFFFFVFFNYLNYFRSENYSIIRKRYRLRKTWTRRGKSITGRQFWRKNNIWIGWIELQNHSIERKRSITLDYLIFSEFF